MLLDKGFYKLEIVFIPDNGVCLSHCLQYSGCDVFLTAGTDACNDNLSHNDGKNTEKNREVDIFIA